MAADRSVGLPARPDNAAQRRHQRVASVIAQAAEGQLDASVSAIARRAGVHRSYLYRHPDLVQLLREISSRGPERGQSPADRVTEASLRADLAHCQDRARRADVRVSELEARLSRQLGHQIWQVSGLGAAPEIEAVERERDALVQRVADLVVALRERTDELDAARAVNRRLVAELNNAPRPRSEEPGSS